MSASVSSPKSPAPRAQETPFRRLHAVSESQLLPAFCPLCDAEGTREVEVLGEGSEPALMAHYCDLCAEALQATVTRNLALLASCTILSVTTVTALALSLGTRHLGMQCLSSLTLSLALPLSLKFFGLWRKPNPALLAREHKGGARLIETQRAAYSHRLTESHMPIFKEDEPIEAAPSRFWDKRQTAFFVPALASLIWWGVVHSLGGTSLRVIHAGQEEAVLLIDGRHSGSVSGSRFEDAKAGFFTRTLGGRRHLKLLGKGGEIWANEERTLWPGRTYIVGSLPPGLCLFHEEKSYGASGDEHRFTALSTEGPVWELEGRVDSWFQPLSQSGEKQDVLEQNLALSGGVRRAIRLLPCP